MKILIIGGTQFVGLAIAREAIRLGHDVDIFHRSDTVPAGTEHARHLKGDRNRDVRALQTGTWDAVIDVCGYRPHEINALADVFVDRVKKYVFISTCSVYDGTFVHITAIKVCAYIFTDSPHPGLHSFCQKQSRTYCSRKCNGYLT